MNRIHLVTIVNSVNAANCVSWGKLIFRNVRKNLQDYMIYFLTLMISVSMFYAFNSVRTQPALNDLDATRQLLSDQLGILLSALSVVVAIVLAFLILYANQFLLKRRKKELGIYTLLGMEKRKISQIFAGETLCVGMICSNHHRGNYPSPALAYASYSFVYFPNGNILLRKFFPSGKF